jgi:threonine dehydrogenase-like Zn-dependent dehydrogenase
MRACGICGSDLHGLYEAQGPAAHTSGHECMGEVVEAGAESRVPVGARVFVYAIIGCWDCEYCRSGQVHLCSRAQALGFSLDGGHAEYVLAPQECCLPVPGDIPDDVATLAGDIIGVAWGQLKRVGARPHELALISGLGPMGLGAVVVAKDFGCRVVATDVNPYRLALAQRLGADAAVLADPQTVTDAVAALSNGRRADIGIECAGRADSLTVVLDNAAKRGRVCLVGENRQATIRPSDHFLRRDLTMVGSTFLSLADYDEVLDVLRRTPAREVITHHFPLAEAPQAFAAFKGGDTGKVILLGGPS